MSRTPSLTSMLVMSLAVAGLTGCNGDTMTNPSDLPPQTLTGSGSLPVFSFAVVPVPIDRQGTISAIVDWNILTNDLDALLLRGTCTGLQFESVAGCRSDDAIGFDRTFSKPAFFEVDVMPGDHTLVVVNRGPFDDVYVYRVNLQ